MYFKLAGETVESVELKCLVISRGLKIDRKVYRKCSLEPAGCCGLNGCVERDIWRSVTGTPCC